MKHLKTVEIEKLNQLNGKLILVEEVIYSRAKEHNQIALKKLLEKEHDILDYEIEVHYLMYGDAYIKEGDEENPKHLLATWTDDMKSILMKEKYWGINDGNCHNTTSSFQKSRDLNSQKHCWLLHSLYDHTPLDWDDIFKIDSVCFDVKIQYEYAINISI